MEEDMIVSQRETLMMLEITIRQLAKNCHEQEIRIKLLEKALQKHVMSVGKNAHQ